MSKELEPNIHDGNDFDVEWYSSRISESHTGRLIIESYVVNKYRDLIGDHASHATIIRQQIIDRCRDKGFGI